MPEIVDDPLLSQSMTITVANGSFARATKIYLIRFNQVDIIQI